MRIRHEDDFNLERNEFGRKHGEPLEFPLSISVFNRDVNRDVAALGCRQAV